jgi:hypothetical protein
MDWWRWDDFSAIPTLSLPKGRDPYNNKNFSTGITNRIISVWFMFLSDLCVLCGKNDFRWFPEIPPVPDNNKNYFGSLNLT